MAIDFDEIHRTSLDGWGFSFRRSQIARFKKYERLLEKAPVSGEVLEIGCSTGFFTAKYLAPRFGKRLLACDVSLVALEKARKAFPGLRFDLGGLPKTSYRDRQFGLVTAIEMLYYLPPEEQRQSLDEIYRILHDGGYCLISVNIGERPYFSVAEIEKLVAGRFEILDTDSMYIGTYYRFIEARIWALLVLVSGDGRQARDGTGTKTRGRLKETCALLFKRRLVSSTCGPVIRILCKSTLYLAPVGLIDRVSRYMGGQDERSVYMILARKRSR